MPVIVITVVALCAFAANSVLCRLALIEHEMGAADFTLVRLMSATVMLVLLQSMKRIGSTEQATDVRIQNLSFKKTSFKKPSFHWQQICALLCYIVCFSYAYVQLDTGLGALILFVSVQFTMIGFHLLAGHRLNKRQWLGVVLSLAGLPLLFQGSFSQAVEALPFLLLMVAAGIGWGVYSVLGKSTADPLRSTMGNFFYATIAAMPLLLPLANLSHQSSPAIAYAVFSGALASGVGYAIWYTAIKHLSALRASISQLSVPIIASLGGVLFLGEPITVGFLLSSALILMGIALVIIPGTHGKTE